MIRVKWNDISYTTCVRFSQTYVAVRKSKVPLHTEWKALVTKELKGKDPEQTLTWHTAEVCFKTSHRDWSTDYVYLS